MAKKEKEEEQLTPQQQKMKALMAAMQKIEKDFGKGSIMKMGDEKIENVEVIPTGSIYRLDRSECRTGRRWLPQGTHHRDLWS